MSEISSLENRIAAALDRISLGLETHGAEKSSETHADGQAAMLEARLEKQLSQLAALDAAVQALRAANARLLETNEALRHAATAGASPDVYDAALAAEIAALKADRAAEAAEMDTIIAELKPMIAGA